MFWRTGVTINCIFQSLLSIIQGVLTFVIQISKFNVLNSHMIGANLKAI